jgi:hypothetical protein
MAIDLILIFAVSFKTQTTIYLANKPYKNVVESIKYLCTFQVLKVLVDIANYKFYFIEF